MHLDLKNGDWSWNAYNKDTAGTIAVSAGMSVSLDKKAAHVKKSQAQKNDAVVVPRAKRKKSQTEALVAEAKGHCMYH